MPATLKVRIIRPKGPDREEKQRVRYALTTLLDPIKYPAEEAASLYHHRLKIEVKFRMMPNRPKPHESEVGNLLGRRAERYVEERPDRSEPRRMKRRPKCTRWLQKQRHSYFEHFRNDDSPLKILDQVG